MITTSERNFILDNAYIPEHLPYYVSAVSGTEPVLIEDFVVHKGLTHLIFIGYPLHGGWDEHNMVAAIEETKAHYSPESISIIAPEQPSSFKNTAPSTNDAYYRVPLSHLVIPKKVRYMLKRARREVKITIGSFSREHKRLLNAFLRNCQCDDATRFIFQRLPEYVKCDHVRVFDARTASGKLVAFDVADFGARDYAFYMYNIRSQKHSVPGVSDLLLAQIIEQAQALEKTYLNLGLGINSGIAFFKKKWGAKPFQNHVHWVQNSKKPGSWWETLEQFSI